MLESRRAWSLRLISAEIRFGGHDEDCLHVFSCYAPTYVASRDVKERFYDDLQQAISEVPAREKIIMLGDFNARVGSRVNSDDFWWNERGPHGYGELNEAGKELLSFLSVNEATVCNTWFQKWPIHKATWQHPGTKSGIALTLQ